MASRPDPQDGDPVVDALARLFHEHPVWLEAAARIADGATSNVYFRHRPGEAWHLLRRAGRTWLRPGAVRDPDFVFRFAPGSVERLQAVTGDVGEFAVALFDLIDAEDPEIRVDFRVAAPWRRLREHGYVRLLLSAGPRGVVYAARHGVRSWRGLRRLVEGSIAAGPFDWEV